jgi:hypothetical protein
MVGSQAPTSGSQRTSAASKWLHFSRIRSEALEKSVAIYRYCTERKIRSYAFGVLYFESDRSDRACRIWHDV